MLPFATTVLAARDEATKRDIWPRSAAPLVEPNGTNAIPSRVTARLTPAVLIRAMWRRCRRGRPVDR
jgi:hypothetical protein